MVKTPPCQPCPSPVTANTPYQYTMLCAVFNQATLPMQVSAQLTRTPSYYSASSAATPGLPFRFPSCCQLCSPYPPQQPSHSARPSFHSGSAHRHCPFPSSILSNPQVRARV